MTRGAEQLVLVQQQIFHAQSARHVKHADGRNDIAVVVKDRRRNADVLEKLFAIADGYAGAGCLSSDS